MKKASVSKRKTTKTTKAAAKTGGAKMAKVSENSSSKMAQGCCSKEVSLFLLRIAIGWVFLYAGLTKLLDPSWTSAGFLPNAQTFSGFYAWLASPENIAWVDVLNKLGLTLIGAGLMTGTLTRYASIAGILLMALYYFPGLNFPYVEHSFLVDQHIVYILVLAVLLKYNAGKYWGLDAVIEK